MTMATYSISLDDVDIALLPLRMQRYNDFLKKEYYEFHVMKKEAAEEPPITFYTCYICDIEVPTAFAREHGASIKHRANANIASVAALRMRALAAAPPPPFTPFAGPPVHFCANCSAVVDEDHDKTKEHSVAVMHDRLLWDLMKAYVKDGINDGSNVIDDSENLCKNEGNINAKTKAHSFDHDIEGDASTNGVEIANDKKNDDLHVDNNVATDSATDLFMESIRRYGDLSSKTVDSKYNKQKVIPVHSRGYRAYTKTIEILKEETTEQETAITKEEVTRQLRNRHVDEPYIELLCKLVDIDYSRLGIKESGGEIQINKQNEIIHVPVDNFHSLQYNKTGYVACIVCKARFHPDYAETHKYEMGHMNEIVNIGDSNCIRKTQFGTSHCIVCNRKLKRKVVAAHVKSGEHIENKRKYTEKITDSSNEERLERVAANQHDNGNINVYVFTGNKNVAAYTKTNTNSFEDKPDLIADNNEGISNMNINENIPDENTVETPNNNLEYIKTNSDATKEIKPDGISDTKEEKVDTDLNENKANEYLDETTKLQLAYTTKNTHTTYDEIPNGIAKDKEENGYTDINDNIANKDIVKTPNGHFGNTNTNTHTPDKIAGNKENIVETSEDRIGYGETNTDRNKGYTPDKVGNNNENSNMDTNKHIADMTRQPKQMCSSEISYPFKETSLRTVQCTICDVELPNTTKSMRAEHVRGRKHSRNEFRIEQAIVKQWVAGAKNSHV